MLYGINVVYLLILVAISLALTMLVRIMQKSAMSELSKALYEDNDPARYMRMLESRFLFLVMRRGTIALMRLDGALFSGSADAVWDACSMLENTKLRAPEKLNWYQKALSFAALHLDKERAKDYLTRIDALLEKEPDKDLHAIRVEAGRLYAIYIERDTSLISELERDAAALKGERLGIALYRLAKLYYFAGDDAMAAEHLHSAKAQLAGSPWLDAVTRALGDLSVLEKEESL